MFDTIFNITAPIATAKYMRKLTNLFAKSEASVVVISMNGHQVSSEALMALYEYNRESAVVLHVYDATLRTAYYCKQINLLFAGNTVTVSCHKLAEISMTSKAETTEA